MIKAISIVVLLLVTPCTASAQSFFSNPESAAYDTTRHRYFISNVGTGDIVQIDAAGDTSFYDRTLTQTLGMVIVDNMLYIVNITGVDGYYLETDQHTVSFAMSGIDTPNDVTADTSGNLYMTDSGNGRIYKINIATEESEVIVSGIYWPNGILFDKRHNRVLFCAFGNNVPIRAIDLEDYIVTTVRQTNFTNLDGLTEDRDGNIYVSSWGSNTIYKYDNELSNPPVVFSSGHEGPADIFYNQWYGVMVVPNFNSNTVEFILDPAGDYDDDGLPNSVDNCPYNPNPGQEDGDVDGVGDICDNCPITYNPTQTDIDGDGIGDGCEVIRSWWVAADGSGDALTIQAAIDSSTHGDTVMVTDGTYTGVGNREIDLGGRRILKNTVNGPQTTIINPQGSSSTPRRAFTIAQGEGAETIIAGLTIRGGYGGSFNGSASGGGMLCNESSPTVRNCVFADNGAVAGAAVYSFRASPQFVNCTFYDNSASLGSAVFSYDQSSVTLENCIIAFNPQGVPVSCYEGSSASATCTDIYGNTAGNWVACLAGQGSANGNFSLNPLFCDTAAGDFSINNNSPCGPENNECAVLIGAQDIGCYCDCGVAGDMDCSGVATPLDVAFLVKFVY